jgi:hypothetical protein
MDLAGVMAVGTSDASDSSTISRPVIRLRNDTSCGSVDQERSFQNQS